MVLPPVFSVARPGRLRAPPTLAPSPAPSASFQVPKHPSRLQTPGGGGKREKEELGFRTLENSSRFERSTFFPEEIWKLFHYEGGSAISK